MTFRLSFEIDANGKAARAELDRVGTSLRQTGKAAEDLGRKGATAASGTTGLGASAAGARTRVDALAAAEARATVAATQLGTANRMAAGNMGNLVAQFNDVGVMLASGQNPLTLALQQGTQISQVIGPMGAAGAVKALGGAFVRMLNPISLITIGSIAAGAAMINWLRSARPAALSAGDALEAMEAAVDKYIEASKRARASTVELKDEFGAAAGAARRELGLIADQERRNVQRAAADAAASVTGGYGTYGQAHQQANIAAQFDLYLSGTGRALGRRMVGPVIAAYEELDAAARGTVDEQIAAFEQLITVYQAAADAVGGISDAEGETLALLAEQLSNLRRVSAEDATVDMTPQIRASRQYYDSRVAGERFLANIRAEELARQAQIHLLNGRTRAESARAVGSARDMLQVLQDENAVRAAILQSGADSIQAALARTAAERRVFEATLATLEVAESVKDELRAAWEEGQRLGNADMARGIREASAAARALVGEIAAAAGAAQSLAQTGAAALRESELRLTYTDDPVALAGALARDRMAAIQTPLRDGASAGEQAYLNQQLEDYIANQEEIARNDQARMAALRELRDAASASKAENDAVAKLTRSLADELAVLRETDPVQKEMLRNREALAGATEGERAAIADLIAQRNAETEALSRQQETWDWLNSTAAGFLDDLRRGGNDLASVFGNLADKIADAAFEAALLGTGPLADLLGGAGGGGLVGQILGAVFPSLAPANINALPKKAAGGMIYGPGSGTSDDVLMFGSSGEFMVNAAATRQHRHLLERINAGMPVPGFAGGGMVGGSSGPVASPAPALIVIENRSSTPVQGEVEETTDSAGRRKQRLILADAVGAALTTPGGGARKAMKSSYGLRTRGALR